MKFGFRCEYQKLACDGLPIYKHFDDDNNIW